MFIIVRVYFKIASGTSSVVAGLLESDKRWRGRVVKEGRRCDTYRFSLL